jgi:hypothetical protein
MIHHPQQCPPYGRLGIPLRRFWLFNVLFPACIFRLVVAKAGDDIDILAAFFLDAAETVNVVQFPLQAAPP